MCEDCTAKGLNRRHLIGAAGLALAGLAALPAAAADGKKTSLTPDQALDALKSGNKKYTSNPQACVVDLAKRRAETAGGQAPWATLVSCSDSRVPPELLFGGLGLGELFVVRNAGNMVDTAAMGTIEYGAAVLGAPLIVVLGHESCGAVAAACEVVTKNSTFPGSIGPMIEPIVPAALVAKGQPGDFVDNTVRENVRRTVAKLKSAGPIVSTLAASGKLKIVGARYDLKTGEVDFFA